MERIVRRCLQLSMKLVNSVIGIVGVAMVLYSLWLIRVWQRDTEGSSSDNHSSFPWFVHAFIGLGVSFCAISCLGHVAADTANTHILCFYVLLVFLLLLLETGAMADVFLNSDWEKDFPDDPSGTFDDFKDIVDSNMDVCKWVGFLIVLAQGFSIVLATVIRTLRRYLETIDNNDDSALPRLPLLNPPAQRPPCIVGGTHFAAFNARLPLLNPPAQQPPCIVGGTHFAAFNAYP